MGFPAIRYKTGTPPVPLWAQQHACDPAAPGAVRARPEFRRAAVAPALPGLWRPPDCVWLCAGYHRDTHGGPEVRDWAVVLRCPPWTMTGTLLATTGCPTWGCMFMVDARAERPRLGVLAGWPSRRALPRLERQRLRG